MPDECADDPSIIGDDRLHRRILPQEIYFDKNTQRWRPMSSSFENNQDGSWMSVHIQSRFDELNLSPYSLLQTPHEHFGLVTLAAQMVRDDAQNLCRCHTDDEPAHTEVAGTKTKGTKKKWARECVWVTNPKDDTATG